METPLHNLVKSIEGPRTAALHEAALSQEIGKVVDAYAADIAEGHGLNFDATPAQSAGRIR